MMKGIRLIAMLCAAVMTASSLTVSAQTHIAGVNAAAKSVPVMPKIVDGVEIFWKSGEVPANYEIPSEFEGKRVAAVAANGFSGCQTLVTLTIPESVAFLYDGCFQNCPKLKTINFSSGLSQIHDMAFKDCTSLTALNLPDSLKNIGRNAFENCKSLKSVRFPEDMSTIEFDAFKGCSSLTDVTFPKGTSFVYSGVLSDCTALKTVTFLDRTTLIYNDSNTICNKSDESGNCVYTGTIRGYVGSTAEKYAQKNGYRFEPLDPENVVTTTTGLTTTTTTQTTTTVTTTSRAETEPVPDWWWGDTTAPDPSVTTAKPVTTTTTVTTAPVTTTKPVTTTTSPFDAENKLVLDGIVYQKQGSAITVCGYKEGEVPKNVVIPEDVAGFPVRTVGENAFAKMKGVESVTLPVNVTAIEKKAFYWCSDLKTLTILNPDVKLNGDFTLICNDDLGMYTGVLRAYYPSETAGFCSGHEMKFEELKEVRGDITLDGIVSIEDAQNTLKAYTESIAGKPSTLIALQKRMADVDGSMTISVEDAQLILKYYTERSVAGKNTIWEELLAR